MKTLKTPSNPDSAQRKNERQRIADEARNRGGQAPAKPAAQKKQADVERDYSKAGSSGGMKGEGSLYTGKRGGMIGEGM